MGREWDEKDLVNAVNARLMKECAAAASESAGRDAPAPPVRLTARTVCVRSAERVPAAFSARFDAVSRSYKYRLIAGGQHEVFDAWTVWNHREPLHWAAVEEGLALLRGNAWDFALFRAQGCVSKTTVRALTEASLRCVPLSPLPGPATPLMHPSSRSAVSSKHSDHRHATEVFDMSGPGPVLAEFSFTSSGFLYHQVRFMVGALASLGRGAMNLEQFQGYLTPSLQGKDAAALRRFTMAPPQGLYLTGVSYR